eukprot:484846-Prorocentrum_minimum.AAC.1
MPEWPARPNAARRTTIRRTLAAGASAPEVTESGPTDRKWSALSALDVSVPEGVRGKYLAFAEEASDGARHLTGLARAGLTHVHLLPAYDFGSVRERASEWREPQARGPK